MKTLLAGAAFVILLASPALAQSFNPDDGDGNVLTGPGYNPGPLWGPANGYGYGFGMYGDNGGLGYDYVRPGFGYQQERGYDYVRPGYGYRQESVLQAPAVERAPARRVSSEQSEPTYPNFGVPRRYQAVETPVRQTTTPETEPVYPTFGVPRRY